MSPQLALAGRGRRLAATLIDMLLVPAFAILIMLVTGVLEHAEDWAASAFPVMRMVGLGIASYLILNGWLLCSRGQTVGKAVMGIAIVSSKTGEKAPFWKLLCIRAPFFPVLYLIFVPLTTLLPVVDQALIFGKQRRCLHDFLCGSSVVRGKRANSE